VTYSINLGEEVGCDKESDVEKRGEARD